MIEVKRTDYPKFEVKNRKTGKVIKTIPKRYVCEYFYGGREIAMYESQNDTLYVKTSLTLRDWSKSIYYRAVNGTYAEAYKELFDMLNVDEKTSMSEYTNL